MRRPRTTPRKHCKQKSAAFNKRRCGKEKLVGKPRSAGRYTVAVDDRTVSVAFWQVHGGDGGADHKLLGWTREM